MGWLHPMESSNIVDVMTHNETLLATGIGASQRSMPAAAAPASPGRWYQAMAHILRGEWLANLFGSEDLAEGPCSRAPWLADECALEHLYEVVSDGKDR